MDDWSKTHHLSPIDCRFLQPHAVAIGIVPLSIRVLTMGF
jgi:hypothetical protein